MGGRLGKPTQPPELVVALIGGQRVRVTEHDVQVLTLADDTIRCVAVDELRHVGRGGRELVLTCRAADPLVLTTTSLADAERLLARLQAVRHAGTWQRWMKPFVRV